MLVVDGVCLSCSRTQELQSKISKFHTNFLMIVLSPNFIHHFVAVIDHEFIQFFSRNWELPLHGGTPYDSNVDLDPSGARGAFYIPFKVNMKSL